ncbi:thiamine phosphate synthase [Halanaerobaculum tunisiense]
MVIKRRGYADDLPVKVARDLLGPEKIIGLSTSNLEEVLAAEKAGVDYIGFGAIYSTASKKLKENRRRIGLERLKQVSSQVDVPLVAIGGIKQENIIEVVQAGADTIAMISAITQAEDIKERVSNLKNIFVRDF